MTIPAAERLSHALADRYRIERELGQGGMATVYLAHDVKHDRKVAVKVLRPELAAVIGAERFLSEIKTTANLQHPHILPLFDSGAADSFLFYVMPFVEGESLRDRLTREKQLPISDGIRLRQNRGTGQYDLMVMRLDSSSAPSPWLATEFLERAPSFSPNDRWVAYSSDESGREEVYVRPFPGPGGRIPVSSGGGTEPAWSPNGKELFYRTGEGLQVVEVESGPEFRVLSRPRTLIRGDYFGYSWARQYDVLPDGSRFLFLRNETPITDLMVVLNWSRAGVGR